jgi:hypothetical protein
MASDTCIFLHISGRNCPNIYRNPSVSPGSLEKLKVAEHVALFVAKLALAALI